MTSRDDLAWAAGFFDGEGCFSGAGGTPHATASQVHLEPLDVFAHTVGIGALKGPYAKATAEINRRPQWVFYTYGARTVALFEQLRPWLGRYKTTQAHKAIGKASLYHDGFALVPWHEQVAWCGGFFEGEGTFSLAGRVLTTRIANTELELVRRFHSTVGTGHIYGPYTTAGKETRKKPQWVFVANGFEQMQALMAMLWPWLSSRRRLTAMRLLDNHLTYFLGCGHERDKANWRKHCPLCFRPGPKPGSKRRITLVQDQLFGAFA